MNEEKREALIQLRYARLKIEKIEAELNIRPYGIPSKKLCTKLDFVIGSLKSAKGYLKEK